MELSSKIYVAGHRGMAGSAVMRRLETSGFTNFVTRTRAELDLTNQAATRSFFKPECPDTVVLAAAKVGGASSPILLTQGTSVSIIYKFKPM